MDTSVPNPRSSADVRRRLSVIDLVHNYVLNGIPRLLPPVSITVLPDDRTIPVAGRDLVFSGNGSTATADGLARSSEMAQ